VRSPRGALAVVLAILIVTVSVLGGGVLGSPTVDGFGTQWFFWFAGEILAGRQSAGWTDLLFYPWGKDLYAHTGGNLIDAWAAAPLRAVFGPVLGFNLWIVVVLTTNALAGARLARAFGATRLWPAALALVLNPYVLTELDLGRPTQAWLAPLGFAVATLVDMRRARDGVLAGIWIALTALTYWYYGLFAGLAAVVVGIERLARDRVWAALLSAAIVATVLVLPFAWPMLQKLDAGAVPGLLALDGTGLLAPLALRTVEGDEQGLYILAPLLGQAGSLIDEGGVRFNAGLPVLGWLHLGVALLGAGLVARRHLALPLLLVIGLVVSSGPVILTWDDVYANKPWLFAVEHVEILRRWWWPGRAVALVHVLIAPLFVVLLDRFQGWRAALSGLLALFFVVAQLRSDSLLPLATWDATPPPALACLARAPRGGVIDLPLLVDQKNLWFQTLHQQPLLGGMLLKKASFAPAEFAALRESNPLMAALDAVGDKQYTRDLPPATAEQRTSLTTIGYRYVLARVDAFQRVRVGRSGQTDTVSEWSRPRRQLLGLLGEPAWEDGALAVWTLGGETLPCVTTEE
jgi:hypothetical protein